MPRKSYRITLLMHSWVGYLHGLLLGIADYFEQRPDWIWTHIMPMSAHPKNRLRSRPHARPPPLRQIRPQ
jgi:hypothetical protein